MADTKISALPASTTLLAGTEVLPIVQSGATKQVSVTDLTAGRQVSVAGLTATGLTANYGLYLNASYQLTSIAMTGSGSLVRDTSPTLNGNWTWNTAYSYGGLNYALKIQYSTASTVYMTPGEGL